MRKLVVLLVLFCTFALQGQEIKMTHKAFVESDNIEKEIPCKCSVFFSKSRLVAIIDFDDLEIFKILSVVEVLKKEHDFTAYLVKAKMDGRVIKARVILLTNKKGVIVLQENDNKGFIYLRKNK